jgi:L-threonylcarbamoyladenylate synthase
MLHRLSLKLAQQVEKAVDILKRGGVVAFPTDTVYGLGANPYIDEAVDRIYKIKGRPRHLPLPILVADETQVNDVVASVSDLAALLMEHFWPGGLTLVLPKAASFPDNATAGGDSVAIRMPCHNVALALIRKAGVPIIGTSANLNNQPSVLTAEEVEDQLGNAVDLIIDGGKCPGGVESTVVDLTRQVPVILRQGAVPEEQINKIYREYAKKADENAYCSRL